MAPRILLIEPSRGLRLSFTAALERCGLHVHAAADAGEAAAMCATFAPDILVADYCVGDEPADEFVRDLRRRNPAVVVVLTSAAFPTAQTLGRITLHPKPSEPRALFDLLRQRMTAESLWLIRRDDAAGSS